jgi:hypothetical protein
VRNRSDPDHCLYERRRQAALWLLGDMDLERSTYDPTIEIGGLQFNGTGIGEPF